MRWLIGGLLTLEYSAKGTPKYKLAKPGYDVLKEHPELGTDLEDDK